ncbi:MAG TPA: hypothetical protein ENF79_04710 [Nitrososphaeria archaeon]|nr:hypothetical protein [Nitrososphaeria archaeon]
MRVMTRELVSRLLLISLLILAAFTPIIYATAATISTWIIGVVVAWIVLAAILVSLAILKWK